MRYNLIFFLKEIKDFLTKFLNQIDLFFKEKKDKEYKNFLNQNRNFFKNFNKKVSNDKGEILVACLAVSHPGFQITQMIIGKYLEKILNLKAIGMQEHVSFYYSKLFKSYNYSEVESFNKINIIKKFNLFLESKRILKEQKNIENFINYEVDGLKIGKIVYEHYIRFTGSPTINKFDFKVNYFLFKALEYHFYTKNLFKKRNIKYVLLSEKQFIPSGIIFQNALINNCKVFARVGGPSSVGLKLFDSKDEFFKSRYNFSFKLVDDVYKKNLDKIIIYADKILKNRFENKKDNEIQDIRGTDVAFKKKKDFTKKTLCEKFGWDISKPIVAIFDHHYLDGLYDSDRLYYRDNLEWITSTLLEIKNIKNVNWLIKGHPSEPSEVHQSKTNTENEFKKIVGDSKHMRLFPDDYSAGLLPKIVSLAVTGNGSVGIEYPCFGIPCILANSAHYSGNGFTVEPQTKKEYFEHLNNITKINKLDNEKINKAKTFLFLEIILSRVNIPLIPNYDIGHKFFSNTNNSNFWKKCSNLILNYTHKDDKFISNLEKQIKSNNKHLINNDIIEYN